MAKVIAEEYEVYRRIADVQGIAYWAENERVRLRGAAWNLEVAAIRVRDAARALEEVLKVYETELGKIRA